jgi:hypothetical protein
LNQEDNQAPQPIEPIDATTKAKHQKDMVRAKRIVAKSIKDHLIPQVASKNTPK